MTEESKEWVDWNNTKVLQKVAVLDEAGNVLMLKRASSEEAGREREWDLVGGSVTPEDIKMGKVDPHKDALVREAREETGLPIDKIWPVFVGSGVKESLSAGNILVLAIGYRSDVKGVKPEPTLSDEHSGYEWKTKAEALEIDFGDDGGFHHNILTSL